MDNGDGFDAFKRKTFIKAVTRAIIPNCQKRSTSPVTKRKSDETQNISLEYVEKMRAVEYITGSKGKSGFGSSSTAEIVTSSIDLSGYVTIVTGSSSGIGLETARVLAKRGSIVIMAVRNVEAGEKEKALILKDLPQAQIQVMEIDLSSINSVRNFADNFKNQGLQLNILINNAGVMWCPFKLSEDGYEMHFATNHLGHFLLVNELLPLLKETANSTGKESRIVNVASIAHSHAPSDGISFDKINNKDSYNSFLAYGQSKLANILHALELSRRLKEEGVTNVTVNALCPGGIRTKLQRHSAIFDVLYWPFCPFFKSIPQGAATQCYVATSPSLTGVSGKYFYDCNEGRVLRKEASDLELAGKLWEFSEGIVNPVK